MRETKQAPKPGEEPDPTPDEIRTFLIADVRGYTAFTHKHGDEAAARLVARFAEIVREQVEHRDGTVMEVRGDEALAVFRSPRQAIRAAVELQTRLLEETIAVPSLPLPVGIGLDAGEAAPVDGGFRGGALNLAARLCSEAGPGEILGSQSLVHLARVVDGVRYLHRGELFLKGLAEPVNVIAISAEGTDVAEQMRARAPAREVSGRGVQFRVLGPLEVHGPGGPMALGGPKQRAVFANLLIRANQMVPAETLIDDVWGEEPPEKARNTLQTYVSNLRKILGEGRLEGRPPGYVLVVDPLEVDASRFEALVRDARKALPIDPNIAVGTLDEALALWRGPALADVADQPSLFAEASRLDDLRLEAQEERIEALMAAGTQSRAVGELETLVTTHPLRESLWGLLILALYREGRQADALNAYQRAREILADELGIDPSPELTRLNERVLQQDPGLELRGEPLRGYRLLEKVGEGPNGFVFRAIQPHVGRDVAVKIFHERIAEKPDFVRRFELEAQAAAALEHPHIVPVYDYWREPGRAYVASRFLRGGSLRALSERETSLDPDRATEVFEQVAMALGFAHRQGVAHGNLSPSNILFDGEANAYIGDFRIGAGPAPDPATDIRELAALARELLGDRMRPGLRELVEQVETKTAVPEAEALAAAARAVAEPEVPAAPARADLRNPYKGLRAFTEADSRDFFGRGELIVHLLDRLREPGAGSRFLAVVGPSGGGKSSAVRAGLVPAIRAGALGDPGAWFVAEMFPGTHPIDELESALIGVAARPPSRLRDLLDRDSRGLLEAVKLIMPSGAELVLVIDQFEEVFTLTHDERERELFLESLRVGTADPDSSLRVVVTLRADFFDRPLVYPRFGELLASQTEAVPPLTPDELEQAIRRPAEGVGVSAESGLVAEIIADVAHQPGALPLLQYALTELFERRESEQLTLTAYQEIGGVAGALSSRADRIFEGSDEAGRRAAKQVFLRLVRLGEGREDTRRRVTRSELDALEVDRAAVESVLDIYGRHRILTFDREPVMREPTVEIAHEALLGAWGRLRSWIDDAREDLRQDRRLIRAGAEWRASDKDPSFLLRGSRLEQVEAWAGSTDLAIGKPERAYLKASVDQRKREQQAEEAQRLHEAEIERRSARRLRGLVVVLTVAALVASSLTLIAVGQRRNAREQSRIAFARELAAASVSSIEEDPERAVLLAMEAVNLTRALDGSVLPEAEDALHRAVAASRIVTTIPGTDGQVDMGDGVFAVGDRSGSIEIRDLAGEPLVAFPAHEGEITGVEFSSDGSMLATTGKDGFLKVWDPEKGALIAEASGEDKAWNPSFSDDGSRAAAVWSKLDSDANDDFGTIRVLDVRKGTVVLERGPFGGANGGRAALSPDGDSLAFSSLHRSYFRVQVAPVDPTDPAEDVGFPGGGFFCCAAYVTWSPDGRYLVQPEGTIFDIWDASTGEPIKGGVGHTDEILDLDWSPDSLLVTGSADDTARVWEIGGGGQLLKLSVPGESIDHVAFSMDGTQVLTQDSSQTVRIWDVSPAETGESAVMPEAPYGGVEFLPDGGVVATGRDSLIVSGPGSRDPKLIGPPFPSPAAIVGEIPISPRFDVSPDGELVAQVGSDFNNKEFGVWDASTARVLFTRPHADLVAWSPDSTSLAVSLGKSVEILDRSGEVVRTIDLGFTPHEMIFTADGRLMAAGRYNVDHCEDSPVIWGEGRSETFEIPVCATQVVLDPTGRKIATLGGPRPQIWDAESGELLLTLPADFGHGMVFSPDGSTIADATGATVRLSDANTGEQKLLLRGHGCAVQELAFSADGSMLASATRCDGARVWVLDIDRLLEVARQNVTRSLTDAECRQYLHLETCPN